MPADVALPCATQNELDGKAAERLLSNHHGQKDGGYVNYVEGANIAGFVKVADAMLAQGVI